MKTTRLLTAVLLAIGPWMAHAAPAKSELISGVNDVQFASASEQPFLGSGFVIEHEGRYFGVTAKHVLLMRNGGPPATTDVAGELGHWNLRDPRSRETLAFGPLLNGDPAEAVTPDVLKLDTLLFELKNPGPFKALHLAAAEPKAGDTLRAIGCSYATEASCAQDQYAGKFIERQGSNLLIDLGEQSLEQMFGLSGAPVLNSAGEVVGIVSNVLPDAKGTPRFAPVDIVYLRTLLNTVASEASEPG
ncbi:MAG: trypsin-like peptidase domain-containing protein [Xanthomonadales bacterium]|nr:trypsin-like peptidase domain-containing protein [Xanthomonadales bacterium]MCP5475701.1 trypsin-like peptidase domain-containing protein [Rhodanobacteraceae bacterium]